MASAPQPSDDYGRRCLLARRMVEKGVRFVCVVAGGGPGELQWDAHSDIEENHHRLAGSNGQASCGPAKGSEAAWICWIRRWWFGVESLDGRRWRKAEIPMRWDGIAVLYRVHLVDGGGRHQRRHRWSALRTSSPSTR